jgi:hypothetical protein
VKNIDRYVVDREGDKISIAFTDLFGAGDKYTVTETDAAELVQAILNALSATDAGDGAKADLVIGEPDLSG